MIETKNNKLQSKIMQALTVYNLYSELTLSAEESREYAQRLSESDTIDSNMSVSDILYYYILQDVQLYNHRIVFSYMSEESFNQMMNTAIKYNELYN